MSQSDTALLRAQLIALYNRGTGQPAQRRPSFPLSAVLDQSTVIQKPGLMLVYGPDAPRHGNLLMSQSEVGSGCDDLGNQYRDGDMAYRDAFTQATPRGRLGLYVPDVNSGIGPVR
jgi:hypothetical protein